MRKLKRVLSFMLAAIMMISMSGMNVMAAEQQETREGYVEIALDNAASTYATNYYSKGLVVLNIATAGVSNECRITSGSVPDGATITKVELKGTKRTYELSINRATDSITLTGGCAKNEGLKRAIEHVLKIKVVDLPIDPQLMGALGAAEYARQKGMA